MSNRHQGIVGNLLVTLKAVAPSDARVRTAPFDVTLLPDTVVEPDVLVARAADLNETGLPGPPLLAVEVLSRSSRHRDLGAKRDLYAKSGVPSYWVVEPGDDETPTTLVAFNLEGSAYVEVARVAGEESWTATSPFAVTLSPVDLLDD